MKRRMQVGQRLARSSGKFCSECGYEIPVYPGRYPNFCPKCGAEIITDDSDDECNNESFSNRTSALLAKM